MPTSDRDGSHDAAIREVARRHGIEALRWWPPNEGDFLVGGMPAGLRELRLELERALGCRVAIYLADHLSAEALGRLEAETVDLFAAGQEPEMAAMSASPGIRTETSPPGFSTRS
jgi:hypothetical protein